jgi:hypothetical protein
MSDTLICLTYENWYALMFGLFMLFIGILIGRILNIKK